MYLCVYLTFTSFNTQCLSVTCISENASGYFIFLFWKFPLFLVYHVDLNQSRDRTRSWTTEVFMLSEKMLSYLLTSIQIPMHLKSGIFYNNLIFLPVCSNLRYVPLKRRLKSLVWINNTSNLLGLGFFFNTWVKSHFWNYCRWRVTLCLPPLL